MDVKLGDEVRIMEHTRYRKTPKDGYTGSVTKVGRKYATATYETTRTDWRQQEITDKRTVEFDMVTGRERGSQTNYGIEVVTPAEAERRSRRTVALAVLAEHKIRLEYDHGLDLDQMEALAALAGSFSPADAG